VDLVDTLVKRAPTSPLVAQLFLPLCVLSRMHARALL
jgi:hypothetical protein